MEQKRTLWIVAASGVFLLVVVGAALILHSPSLSKNDQVQTYYNPRDGWTNGQRPVTPDSNGGVAPVELAQADSGVIPPAEGIAPINTNPLAVNPQNPAAAASATSCLRNRKHNNNRFERTQIKSRSRKFCNYT